ncbi:MAG TPA: hypothetical protein VFH78_10315 [Candidatus Thermoplasmatota archaeon]|nr:hypothetical protein [Candidatus Thermoplasmatota archaeon]
MIDYYYPSPEIRVQLLLRVGEVDGQPLFNELEKDRYLWREPICGS